MPWGIAAGIVPKNTFSKNREFKTFSGVSFFIFLGISLRKSGETNKHRRRCECVTRIDGVFYSLPRLIKNKPDVAFNASTCGDNCAKYILEIAKTQDITINSAEFSMIACWHCFAEQILALLVPNHIQQRPPG